MIFLLIYILLPAVAVVTGVFLCRERFKNKGRAVYCIFIGTLLFIIAAVRYAVGYDYVLYANWFASLRFMSGFEVMHWSREKGFAVPVKLLSDMFVNPQIMFALIALVITVGVMLLIYKRSAVPWVSVTAFLTSGLFFISMNFMRQFIAAVIISFALRYVAKKRFFRYAGLVLFASTFHYSALFLLPFYFIFKIKLNYITLLLMLAGSAVAYIFVTPLMNFATNFFYTGYDPVSRVEAAGGLSIIYTIAFASFFVVAFVLRKMIAKRNRHTNTLLMAMFFAVFFGLLGTSHAILSRLALLFIIAPVLILSAEIYSVLTDLIRLTFKDSKKVFIVFAAVMNLFFFGFSGAYYCYLISDSVNFNGVVPYQTIFSRHSTQAEEAG